MEQTTFDKLGVSQNLLHCLEGMGFQSATPVQEISIAPLMAGYDISVQAPTGTGKTCAFGIPIVEKADAAAATVQTLVLSPTRELAIQIASVLRNLAKYKPGLRVVAVYGGERIEKQFAALRRRPQIVVATPGRLLDHIARRTIRLQDVRMVVLDEADRMLDMGFRPDLNRILESVPAERQTALFSATMSKGILAIAETYQREPQMLRIEQKSLTVESVKQYYTEVCTGAKEAALAALLKKERFGLSLVFVNTKRMAEKLSGHLQKYGLRVDALHGDMRQNQRDKVMKQYRSGELDVLVATDVASRGIDVYHIDAVINYDIPIDCDSYVHRIGRTGRADQYGVAYTLIYPREREQLKLMMRSTKAVIIPTGPAIETGLDSMEFTQTVRQNAIPASYGQGKNSRHSKPDRRQFAAKDKSRCAAGRYR